MHHAMARHDQREAIGRHRVSHGTRRTRVAGSRGHFAVAGRLPVGNRAARFDDATLKQREMIEVQFDVAKIVGRAAGEFLQTAHHAPGSNRAK